jgi:Zn-dependent M28 family amino/carboxypeptidase
MTIGTTFRRKRLGILGAIAMLLAMVPTTTALAAPAQAACDNRTNNTYDNLLECVRVEGVREHQAALQEIADENGGNRAAGLPGYDASVAYVVETLEAAGWEVELDVFDFEFTPQALLEQLTPIAASYETGHFTLSGVGEVTGNVIPVDINLVPPRDSTSGCEGLGDEDVEEGGVNDFAGLDFSGDSDIALIQRGECFFWEKAANAEAAGAEAVIIFNQGNDPTREALIVGTLENEFSTVITIPVVGASFADGVSLALPGSTAHVVVFPSESRPQVNVIAELEGENDDNVVMAGAHLDSVTAGPGINDNGSGVGALLEIAEAIAKLKPENTLRFAFWGAEEEGLLGSQAYVDGLSESELDDIALYLNFDMVGSPNYIFMVYDSDESTFAAPEGVPIPEGSIAIEDVFESYYTLAGEPYDDAAFDGRSDYLAFILAGIPSGGLFTGAEVPKTAEQAAIWGGTVGAQFDPCYHLACDTFDNVSLHALDVNVDAIAFAILTYAYSTETVNGVEGREVPGQFTIPAPAGSEGTFGGDGGLRGGPVPA